MIKTPSKYLSLEYLEKIKAHNYSNPDVRPTPEYEPSEVDALIWDKEFKKAEKKVLDEERKERQDEKLRDAKKHRKVCTSCGTKKTYKKFDDDKSKKHTGKRSHCKQCRREDRQVPF